jgi:hypothetical protein
MSLVLGVNSYATLGEADLYFENRIDVAAWLSAADESKEQALVTATAYLDQLSFAGYTTEDSQNLAWPRKGGVSLPSRGRDLVFSSDYVWTDISTETNFDTAFKQLPYEIQLIKRATAEQAYHLINNDGLFDYTGDTPDTIKVGSITLDGLGRPGSAPERPKIVNKILQPLRGSGAPTAWFRSN